MRRHPQPCLRVDAIRHESYAPDGGDDEGPMYWDYATFYNSVFLAAPETALGTDFELSKAPGFSETGLYGIYLTGPLKRPTNLITFNFGDGKAFPASEAFQFCWLGRKFNQPFCSWYGQSRAAPTALSLLWFDPAGAKARAEEFPLDRHFRGIDIVTMRSA